MKNVVNISLLVVNCDSNSLHVTIVDCNGLKGLNNYNLSTTWSSVCRSQILTYKVDPCDERIKYWKRSWTHNIGIQMKRKKQKHLIPLFYRKIKIFVCLKIFHRFKGWPLSCHIRIIWTLVEEEEKDWRKLWSTWFGRPQVRQIYGRWHRGHPFDSSVIM